MSGNPGSDVEAPRTRPESEDPIDRILAALARTWDPAAGGRSTSDRGRPADDPARDDARDDAHAR